MFTPSRLALGRKCRGLTLVRLGEAAALSTRILSDYENSHAEPSAETLQRLAGILQFPVSFFSATDLDGLPADAVSFRAASKVSARKRDIALNLGELARGLHDWIDARFRLPAPDIPTLTTLSSVQDGHGPTPGHLPEGGPELAAEIVRARWGLGNDPAPNMVHLLEAHGVRMCSLPRACLDVDAFSLWLDGIPFIYVNTTKTAERNRFDNAHELGHLVLHKEKKTQLNPESEREADRFAAAFLMPRDSVLARVPPNPSVQYVLKAKRIWKVAAIALAHRLHEIGLSTEWHYRMTCVELGKRGYRNAEPLGIPRETSQVLGKVFRAMRDEDITPAAIAHDLHIRTEDLNDLVFGLVVTAVQGDGSGGATDRPRLNVVR
jgi:Zn-dependent peptidase ImmA (M78 family)/transcriptional regulator with XRE-family HTH domain